MANYYGTTRSNYFSVTNPDRLNEIISNAVGTEDDVVLFDREFDCVTKYGFGCHSTISGYELIDRIYRAIIHMSKYANVFVREAGCITRTEASKAHFEINAVADIALWHARQTQFRDIPATQVKRLIAGHGKATKEQVAKALQQFICHPYENYDESDAVAVGIASLILEGYTSRNARPDNCCFIESTERRVAYA